MIAHQLVSRYTQAIFELAQEKQAVEKVEQELKQVAAVIDENEGLAHLLYHPLVPAPAKKETIQKVFASELTDYVYHFLLLLVDKRRETALPAIIREFSKAANRSRNQVEAQVITARPLSDEQNRALQEKLSTLLAKKVILNPVVDTQLMGGIVVKISDKLIDGSIGRQLKSMQQVLLRNDVTKIGVTS